MAAKKRKRSKFSTINPNSAGIDIGSRLHVVAVPTDRDDDPVKTFQSFTGELYQLADWLEACKINTVAMESTGIYWMPLYEILISRGIEVVVSNARDVINVPGRKTDVNDAQWLRQLHEFGLLRGSFHPTADFSSLRSYIRQRERLLDYAASHIQHIQKALMLMNVQLHHVVSDITGKTGMRIVHAILAGERDPQVLAEMRDVRCKASVETIAVALEGNYTSEHLFALNQVVSLYETYQAHVSDCDRELELVLNKLRLEDSPSEPLPKARNRTKQPKNYRRF